MRSQRILPPSFIWHKLEVNEPGAESLRQTTARSMRIYTKTGQTSKSNSYHLKADWLCYHTVQVLAAWLSHKEIYEHSKISNRTIFYDYVIVGGGRGKILCSATFNQLDLHFLLIHDDKLVKLYTCAKYFFKQPSSCRDISSFALWHFARGRSWPRSVIAAFFPGGGVSLTALLATFLSSNHVDGT